MAQFDVSFLNPKVKGSGGQKAYSFLTDQLSIKENQLAADGKLSPGDYDVLVGLAQNIYSNPGLTADQRSNINVKISEYRQKKSTTGLKDSNDISRMNNELKDDISSTTMLVGNNPTALLGLRTKSLHNKLNTLSASIASLEAAGDDPSNHYNEFNATLAEYNDLMDAYSAVQGYTPSGKPAADLVAYVMTNSRGEITSIDFGRPGSKTGYLETNGLYGGLQIYGKVNKKENNKNIFMLGKETFSAPDVMTPDPQNPLSMKASTLTADSLKRGGTIQTAQYGVYKDMDPTSLVTQSAIRPGDWAKGSKGFLYYRKPDGTYVKYVNADPAKLGISENDVLSLPSNMENNMTNFVQETVDGSKPFNPPVPLNAPASQDLTNPIGPMNIKDAFAKQQPAPSISPTASPTERAPKTTTGIAGQALNAAKSFFGKIINFGD